MLVRAPVGQHRCLASTGPLKSVWTIRSHYRSLEVNACPGGQWRSVGTFEIRGGPWYTLEIGSFDIVLLVVPLRPIFVHHMLSHNSLA